MASRRRVLKKRVGPDGVEIACEQDDDRWVDIKETTRDKYERGRSAAFQATVYTRCNDSTRREYEDEPKVTFKNPEDQSQRIEYLKSKGANHGIVKTIFSEAGRGQSYQKTKIRFCNGDENTKRKVREQRVENEETGDYIMVERIERYDNEWGRGQVYQRKNVHPCNTEQNITDSTGPCKIES